MTSDPRVQRKETVRQSLALHPDIVVLGAATFLLLLGQHLWFQFVPRYLTALGASVLLVGLWGSLSDLLDAAWQYPGGWLTDRWGTRGALVTLTAISVAGLALVLVADVVWVFIGLCAYMALKAYSQPVTFAVIGAALPRERRAMGFVVQSVLHRVPALLGPPVAGFLISMRFGVVRGVQAGVLLAIILSLAALWAQSRYDWPQTPRNVSHRAFGLPRNLRRLLGSDILIRMGESATKVFTVLYVVDVLGYSDFAFGILIAVQVLTSLVCYMPAARRADRGPRKPWVALTFLFFTVYPLLIPLSYHWTLLVLAFVVAGLKEIGEPARKATIVDWAQAGDRGRTVGTYYAVRGLSIMPIPFLAALLWVWNPWAPFAAGALLSLLGLTWYVVGVPNEGSPATRA